MGVFHFNRLDVYSGSNSAVEEEMTDEEKKDILSRTRVAGEFYDVLSKCVYDYCCLVEYPCDIHKGMQR